MPNKGGSPAWAAKYGLIGLAGVAGALCRWRLGLLLNPEPGGAFPAGTFAVNLAGCLLLGYLNARFATGVRLKPVYRSAITAGFIGSFTTFSALSYETLALWRSGHAATAVLYAAVSAAAGLACVAAGEKWAGRPRRRDGA
ncbi:fluoride efflux transporter CrcB [Paenibacillus thermoaerophilus]|uniref:Fluoride-specific ion channel FluC n=1 Tax=Paenibacillus thermoaerophilus TaxID=1215385 RepID=A0ABW2V597_9BACL|nr:fluoride efflux transporter CrcB [Paenibacillus thermoaerophilus]